MYFRIYKWWKQQSNIKNPTQNRAGFFAIFSYQLLLLYLNQIYQLILYYIEL